MNTTTATVTRTAREAYRLWAPTYSDETAVSFLENALVTSMNVAVRDRRLLDAGCGTARRLSEVSAALAVGIDLSPEMLSYARETSTLAAADLRALPLAAGSFDVVWCRLAIGHVPEVNHVYAELARVCVTGGAVIVTDFAPDAARNGWRRTFRDEGGTMHQVEHFVHEKRQHLDAARMCGMECVQERIGVVGDEVRAFYADAGRLAAFDAQRGQALVVAYRFTNRGGAA